jgi:orotidine-5'-phosphate decarboxylase
MKNILNDELRKTARDRLIFALDIGGGMEEALAWVARLKDHVGLFKVGKEAFTHYGPEIVRHIVKQGSEVFLDLKFHDIPNTVARAAEGATLMGASMFNVHALGGRKMMEETVASVRRKAAAMGRIMPVILAVTVLTSLSDDDLRAFGFTGSTGNVALTLSKMAQDAGVTGVVASAQDVEAIREACGPQFVIVTPGIRSSFKIGGDDQKRTLSPGEAIRRGADYLVVGRPIRTAENPILATEEILKDISKGLLLREY